MHVVHDKTFTNEMADKTDKFCIAEHGLVGFFYPFHDSVKTTASLRRSDLSLFTGFIQKIATIFQGLFKDLSRTTLDFQEQPTRNIISQIVQKCIFPVYSNKTLRL